MRAHVGRAALTALGFGLATTLAWAKALPCVIAKVTHHPCPGCGSTRAVLALLVGDFDGVLRANPFGPVMAIVMGILAVEAVLSVLRDGDLRHVATGPRGRVL